QPSNSRTSWHPKELTRCSSDMPETTPNGDSAPAYTVLVADDNEVAQRLCKRVLEKAGYAVLIAADGLQAVDIALKQRPAMILMDVAMPGIDGLEAMRRIKAEVPTMPIVIASAHSMSSDRERFLAAGADNVLSKPFRLADLISMVQSLVDVKCRT